MQSALVERCGARCRRFRWLEGEGRRCGGNGEEEEGARGSQTDRQTCGMGHCQQALIAADENVRPVGESFVESERDAQGKHVT